VSSYQQAIALDSLDPQLRVDYGGLLYGLEALGEASRQFEMAVSLKPQYANAWYNWAWVLKKQNYLQDAVNKMQQAVAAVDPISSDYEKARGELDEWEEELGQAIEQQKQQQEASELTQPEPLPSPQLEEPIELPGDAAPPLDEVPQEEEIAPTEQPPTEAIEE